MILKRKPGVYERGSGVDGVAKRRRRGGAGGPSSRQAARDEAVCTGPARAFSHTSRSHGSGNGSANSVSPGGLQKVILLVYSGTIATDEDFRALERSREQIPGSRLLTNQPFASGFFNATISITT